MMRAAVVRVVSWWCRGMPLGYRRRRVERALRAIGVSVQDAKIIASRVE